VTHELKPGEREERLPEPNTLEAARALAEDLNRDEPDRRCSPWYVGGLPPEYVVLRYRYWMPEDVESPVAEVEAQYLEDMRDIHPRQYAGEIDWRSIELHGSAPDTRVEVIFSPTRAPERRYGVRWRVWPLTAPTVESALDYFDIGVMEFFADGIGADARLGRLATRPGEIRWLTPEV
jgi:hypothetical protein